MKASIGPAFTPSSPPSQPSWKTATVTPERCGDRQQVHHRGLQWDHERPEHHDQQQGGQPDHRRDECREPRGDDAREVDPGRRRAADQDPAAGCAFHGRQQPNTGPDGISHWGDPATVASLAGAAASLGSFFVIEARTAEPLLPLRILRDRNRIGVYVMLLFLAAAFFGMFFFVTLFLQTVWGYSAIRAGSAYLPFIGTFIVVSGVCSQIVPRIGVRIPMTIGARPRRLRSTGSHGSASTAIT
jgi:hypothetical protein